MSKIILDKLTMLLGSISTKETEPSCLYCLSCTCNMYTCMSVLNYL